MALTLRHPASGDNYPPFPMSLDIVAHHFVILFRKYSTVCRAIVGAYKDEVISCLVTNEEWKSVADQFEKKWNVPHAITALDGKHIAIKKPAHSIREFIPQL